MMVGVTIICHIQTTVEYVKDHSRIMDLMFTCFTVISCVSRDTGTCVAVNIVTTSASIFTGVGGAFVNVFNV